VPDIGEMSEAETFLNFISLHPKVSSATKGSNNQKSKSTILTDTQKKRFCGREGLVTLQGYYKQQ